MQKHGCIYTVEIKGNKMAANKKKKKKGHKKILLLVFELLLLAILLAVVWLYNNTFNKIKFETLEETEAGINKDIDTETVEVLKEGYTTIALFGLDNRSKNNYESGNSDTIMVANIDNATKEVKLVSVYRDTYLNTGNGNLNKANAAYAHGGAVQAVQMLNSNLDLMITDYVCVDWAALVEAIDALGGVDIEITQAEMNSINKYLHDVDKVTGLSTSMVTQYGMVHLDGSQATTYARIRKLAGDDYKRASRQRIVIQAMLTKAKQADVASLTKMCNVVFDDISTTLSISEILSLAKDVASYEIVSTTGFPFDLTNARISGPGDIVVPASLASNVKKLHEYLFDDQLYTVSNSVQSISDNISYKTGITDNSMLIDTSSFNETAGKTGTEDVVNSQ